MRKITCLISIDFIISTLMKGYICAKKKKKNHMLDCRSESLVCPKIIVRYSNVSSIQVRSYFRLFPLLGPRMIPKKTWEIREFYTPIDFQIPCFVNLSHDVLFVIGFLSFPRVSGSVVTLRPCCKHVVTMSKTCDSYDIWWLPCHIAWRVTNCYPSIMS